MRVQCLLINNANREITTIYTQPFVCMCVMYIVTSERPRWFIRRINYKNKLIKTHAGEIMQRRRVTAAGGSLLTVLKTRCSARPKKGFRFYPVFLSPCLRVIYVYNITIVLSLLYFTNTRRPINLCTVCILMRRERTTLMWVLYAQRRRRGFRGFGRKNEGKKKNK